MPLSVVQGEAAKAVGRALLRGNGINRQFRSLRMMTASGLRVIQNFTTPLTPTASPTSVRGLARSNGAGARATTGDTMATPNGGTGPYTYQWAIADGVPMLPVNPRMAQTAFRYADGPGVYEATAQCTVTDAFGQSGICYVLVNVTITGVGAGAIE